MQISDYNFVHIDSITNAGGVGLYISVMESRDPSLPVSVSQFSGLVSVSKAKYIETDYCKEML